MAKFGVWTKVEDELPDVNKTNCPIEDSEEVITCNEIGEVINLIRHRYGERCEWVYNIFCDYATYDGPRVVAWMPLPAPMEVKHDS